MPYGQQLIPRLIELHKQGKFPIEKISKVYPVADLKKATADMKNGVVRLLITGSLQLC
jgi:Zn-dependent alcohol dehydrogenase